MDLQQFLAEAPIGSLLGLMVVPAFGALILIGYLVIVWSRRSKKPKMKLGIQPKNETEESAPVHAALESAASPPELDVGVLRAAATPTAPQVESSAVENTVESPPPVVPPANPAPPSATEPVELLRLLRDPETGQFVVEVGRKRYTKLTDITDKKVGQYILKLTAHLLAFTNGVIVTEAGMKSVYNPKGKSGTVPKPLLEPEPQPRPEPLVPPPSPEAQAAFLASLQANPPGQAEPQPAKPRGLFGRRRSSTSSALPTLNLADEINEIAQNRLRNSDLAQTTHIEITSNMDGGIRIHVNGQYYASPNDIPDPKIKTLIKNSIKEWERS